MTSGLSRTNNPMVFAIFSQLTGRIIGTVRGNTRVEAMGVIRRHLGSGPLFGLRTSQDVLLYPVMNLDPQSRLVAKQGIVL